MRGEVISVLLLKGRYLVPLSGAKIRLYFHIVYTLSTFRNECKNYCLN